MKIRLITFVLFLIFVSSSVCAQERKFIRLIAKEGETIYKNFYENQLQIVYDDTVFEVYAENYEPRFVVNNKEYSLDLTISAECVQISKIENGLYNVIFSELGAEECYVFSAKTSKLEKLFIDIPSQISINLVDGKGKVVFANDHNSDKDINSDEKVVLYLFSTEKKERVKIAEKYGSYFKVKLAGDNKIIYNDQNNKSVQLDYSDWVFIDSNKTKTQYLETEITADSYLTEGTVMYLPEKLKETKQGTPWVEGKDGDGIGSIIRVKAKSEISSLIISNGFDSSKTQTYFNNNRVKSIKISDSKAKENNMIVELPDSKSPFEIQLSFKSSEVEIEIQSVYKGDKFADTCLNYILAK